jgi:hypothetical protein
MPVTSRDIEGVRALGEEAAVVGLNEWLQPASLNPVEESLEDVDGGAYGR